MRNALLSLLILIGAAFAKVDGLNADGSLDRGKISKAYFEGDFDMVVNALETWRKMQPNPTREDKIYAYKYLSVIYAAKPETRPKAESFMYQLLKLMPSIELMDLYISDNIEAIFNSVRLRFERQAKVGLDSGQGNTLNGQYGQYGQNNQGAPAAGTTATPANALAANPPGKGSKPGTETASIKGRPAWPWWTAGAVGVAAAVAGYVYFSQPTKVASAPNSVVFQ